jgi:AcrR family transcriptional regulator
MCGIPCDLGAQAEESAKPWSHAAILLCDGYSHNMATSGESTQRDARAVKSAKALRNAFLALIEHKPLDQITIRDIVTEAGVHTATFYRHYPTKEALLDEIAADQIKRLVALTLPVLDKVDSQAANLALCIYVEEHRTLWTALLTGGAAGAMREEWLRISRSVAAERTPEGSWLPSELGVKCAVNVIYETLAWWLAEPPGSVPIGTVSMILHRLLSSLLPQDNPG